MREITAARSTLNYHIAPYASIFLNHSVNLWYAVIRGDNALIAHRIAGCIAQSSYLSTYLWNSAPIKAADNKKWLQWVLGILVGIFFHLHGVLPLLGANSQYMTHIAFLGAVTGVGLAASPLATVVRARPFASETFTSGAGEATRKTRTDAPSTNQCTIYPPPSPIYPSPSVPSARF